MKLVGSFLFAVLLLSGRPAFAQSALIGDIMQSGGMPIPNAPGSSGASVYADGHVVTYKNFFDHSVVTTVAQLTTQQVNKLLRAGANLSPVTLVRDTTLPECADAPYVQIAVRNAAGQMVTVQDDRNCVMGYRPDAAGGEEAAFLKALESVATYGSY